MSGLSGVDYNAPESVADLIEPKPKGHAFKFKLSDGTGGTYRTPDATDEDGIKDQLFKKFGLTVKTVELVGGES
jgi:hypothetical protein